jgi:hypothetical protein
MYQKQKFKTFPKIFFKDFLYISLFISLFVVSVVTLLSERTNKITFITNFYTSQFKLDRFFDVKSLQSNDFQKFIVLDLKTLIEGEKMENMSYLFSDKHEIYFNINEKFNSEKINFQLKPKNVLFNLGLQTITFDLEQSYSFFDYKKLSDKEVFLISTLDIVRLSFITSLPSLTTPIGLPCEALEETPVKHRFCSSPLRVGRSVGIRYNQALRSFTSMEVRYDPCAGRKQDQQEGPERQVRAGRPGRPGPAD